MFLDRTGREREAHESYVLRVCGPPVMDVGTNSFYNYHSGTIGGGLWPQSRRTT